MLASIQVCQVAANPRIAFTAWAQVYLAHWNQTQVAAKVLLGEDRAESDPVAAADQAVALSRRVCQGLKQVEQGSLTKAEGGMHRAVGVNMQKDPCTLGRLSGEVYSTGMLQRPWSPPASPPHILLCLTGTAHRRHP